MLSVDKSKDGVPVINLLVLLVNGNVDGLVQGNECLRGHHIRLKRIPVNGLENL